MDTQSTSREVALFAGGGLGLLGTVGLLGHELVCAVEWDEYAANVLAARMRDGWLDEAPIWDDVRTFEGRPWRGNVDVLSAGFPCQPFSVAGRRLAGDDPRNGWPHTARIIGEVRPPIAWLENVPGLVNGSHGYFGEVLGDLAALGYDAVWCVLAARDVGAPHQRQRLFVLAIDAHADGERLERLRRSERGAEKHALSGLARWWEAEPAVGRVVDGGADRVDRLRALGNGQVPAQVVAAWRELWGRAIERGLF